MSSKEAQEERDRKAGGVSPADAIGATQLGGAAAASDEAETPPGSGDGDGAAAKAQSGKPAKSKDASAKQATAKGASSKSAKKAAAKSNKRKEGAKASKTRTGSSKSPSSGSSGSSGRLKPGELDDIVLDYMRKHPDELPISPTGISKGTGRSSGAIGNCLERLKKAKKVRRVEDKPRKYDLPKEK